MAESLAIGLLIPGVAMMFAAGAWSARSVQLPRFVPTPSPARWSATESASGWVGATAIEYCRCGRLRVTPG